MANPEHLEKLKEGVGAWNQWRAAHPEIIPDLRGADLFRAKLAHANLTSADLGSAKLSEVDLLLPGRCPAGLSRRLFDVSFA